MSAYVQAETKFTSEEDLICALTEVMNKTGKLWERADIEVHSTPQSLYGYAGRERAEKAHIIIRKNKVGGASNDIGFVKGKDGTYSAIISQFDRNWYGETYMGRVAQSYAKSRVVRNARKKGYKVTTTEEGGKVKLVMRRRMR